MWLNVNIWGIWVKSVEEILYTTFATFLYKSEIM